MEWKTASSVKQGVKQGAVPEIGLLRRHSGERYEIDGNKEEVCGHADKMSEPWV